MATVLSVLSPRPALAAEAAFLDATPSFKPVLEYTESYENYIVPGSSPQQTSLRMSTVLKVTGNVEGAALHLINADTELSFTFGEFSFSGTFGSDPAFRPGRQSVYWPLAWNGQGEPLRNLGVWLSWNSKRVTLTVKLGKEVGGQFNRSMQAGSVRAGEEGTDFKKVSDMVLGISGIGNGTRDAYMKVKHTWMDKTVAGEQARLHTIKITGVYDTTPPVLTLGKLKSGLVLKGTEAPFMVLAHDALSTDSFMEVVQGPEASQTWPWTEVTTDLYADGPGGTNTVAGYPVWPEALDFGRTVMKVRSRDAAGNLGYSPDLTLYRALPASNAGRWEGSVMRYFGGPSELTGVISFIMDGRGAIQSGRLRVAPMGQEAGGAVETLPFVGFLGNRQVVTIPRRGKPTLYLRFESLDIRETGEHSEVGGVLFHKSADTEVKVGYVTAYRTPYSRSYPVPPEHRGRFNLAYSGLSANGWMGQGYGAVDCAEAGDVQIAGRTADGVAYSSSGFVGFGGRVALLASMYGGQGHLWLASTMPKLASLNAGDFVAEWYRPASTATPAPIFGALFGKGGRYTVPDRGVRIMALDASLPLLEARRTEPGDPAEEALGHAQVFQVSPANLMVPVEPNVESFRITDLDERTGVITGTFRLPTVGDRTGGTASWYAQVVGDAAYGHYILPGTGRNGVLRYGEVEFKAALPRIDGPQEFVLEENGYKAAGVTLGRLEIGFVPLPGQVITLVRGGDSPVQGIFTGLPEGSLVTVSVGGASMRLRISYIGGASGHDITLTYVAEALPVQLRHVLRDESPAIEYYQGFEPVMNDLWLVAGQPGDSTYAFGSVAIYEAATGLKKHTLRPPVEMEWSSDFARVLALSGRLLAVAAPSYKKYDTEAELTETGLVFLYDLPPDGTAPVLLATLHHPDLSRGATLGNSLALSGNRLVVGCGGDVSGMETHPVVYVYDVSTPAQPVLTRTIERPGSPSEPGYFGMLVGVWDHYVVAYDSDLYLFDLNQPAGTAPAVLGQNSPNAGWAPVMAMSGPYLVAGNLRGASDPEAVETACFDLRLPAATRRMGAINSPERGDDADMSCTAIAMAGSRVAFTLLGNLPIVWYPDGSDSAVNSVYVWDLGAASGVPRFVNRLESSLAGYGLTRQMLANNTSNVRLAAGGNRLVVAHPYAGEVLKYEGLTPDFAVLAVMHDMSLPPSRSQRRVIETRIRTTFRHFGDGIGSSSNPVGGRQTFSLSGGRLAAAWNTRVYEQTDPVKAYNLTGSTPTVPDLTFHEPLIAGGAVLAGSGRYLLAGSRAASGVSVFDLTTVAPTTVVAALGDGEQEAVATAAEGKVSVRAFFDSVYRNRRRVTVESVDSSVVLNLSPPANAEIDTFGNQLSLSGSLLAVGDDQRVWIYHLNAAQPAVPVHEITAPAAAQGRRFAYSVSLSGRRLAVSAPDEVVNELSVGAVYVYDLAGATPTVPALHMVSPSTVEYRRFGHSVSLYGAHLAVGAPGRDFASFGFDPAAGQGFVCLYDLTAATPETAAATLTMPAPAWSYMGDLFGSRVVLSGGFLAVSAPGDDTTGTENGGIYVYRAP